MFFKLAQIMLDVAKVAVLLVSICRAWHADCMVGFPINCSAFELRGVSTIIGTVAGTDLRSELCCK